MCAAGYDVFTEDEAAVQMQQNPKYGWRPTGGRETSKTTFSTRSIRMFGAMSKDRLIISIVDSANSETFQEFLEGIRRDHPKFYMVLDNVSFHKSKSIQKYVESAGGDIAFEFLPPYTPPAQPHRDCVEGSQETAGRQVFQVCRRAETRDNHDRRVRDGQQAQGIPGSLINPAKNCNSKPTTTH